jgi:hypothetical protein
MKQKNKKSRKSRIGHNTQSIKTVFIAFKDRLCHVIIAIQSTYTDTVLIFVDNGLNTRLYVFKFLRLKICTMVGFGERWKTVALRKSFSLGLVEW